LTQRSIDTNDGHTCITNPHGLNDFICIRDSDRDPKAAPAQKSRIVSSQPSDNTIAELNFTEEESEAAITIRIFKCALFASIPYDSYVGLATYYTNL
jgi:hypothetical protein